jgi:hypothetical protein
MPAISAVTLIAARIRSVGLDDEEQDMKEHEFTLILTADPSEDEADKLYGVFNDGTIATIAGVPQIHFHREAGSLEEAIRSAIGDVHAAGFKVERVEMEPGAVLQAS